MEPGEIKDIDFLKKKIDTLNTELSLKNEQCKIIDKLTTEYNEIKEEFKKYTKETEKCKKKYEQRIEECERTKQELLSKWNEKYNKKCIATMAKNQDLLAEQEDLRKRISDKTNMISSLEKELEETKQLNEKVKEESSREISNLKKEISDLRLQYDSLKSSFDENQENINLINQKDFERLNLENKQLTNELQSVKKENTKLKKKLNEFQSIDINNSSKSVNIDEAFSLQKLETDNRFIKYYNNREKRLQLIEDALKKDTDEARKLYIIEQIQEKFVQDDIKETLKDQEEQIANLQDLNKYYTDISEKINEIKENINIEKENPLINVLEDMKSQNDLLIEKLKIQEDAYYKFTKAASKIFSIYKAGFKEMYDLLKSHKTYCENLIDGVEDVALRINLHHPLISFYKKMSNFAFYRPNENND